MGNINMVENKSTTNPIGLYGIDFIEFSSPEPLTLTKLFADFGFCPSMVHESRAVQLYTQGAINLLVNTEPNSFATKFNASHGPSIPAMGWRVHNAAHALDVAVKRGAKAAVNVDYVDDRGQPIPAIYGIGDSLIYFIDQWKASRPQEHFAKMGFMIDKDAPKIASKGFLAIDHLTNNVPQGTMAEWTKFYKDIFGFTDVRYFDIRGAKTGLTSYALRSPCGLFCIPINEGTESKSQINEYLKEYKGPGIQHIAFTSSDIIASLRAMRGTSISTLSIDDEYYEEVFTRVPNVSEDPKTLKELQILVDGDHEGYLLQIFTRNLIGPIFIEIIQRKNHLAFGEGNFSALFRSLERDQERRGVL